MISSVYLVVLLLGTTTISCSRITFPSAESRTHEGKIVWNEVSWRTEGEEEIWEMRQSHFGEHYPKKDWDELRITVKDKKVIFSQLKAGKEVPFKVSCFMCHSNGPRAIRPDVSAKLSFFERGQIALMNLRIKLYGPLEAIERPSFRHQGVLANEPLKLAACTGCHNSEGIFSRGQLTRQNSVTIKFMVEQQHMPPIGSLTQSERRYLEDFMLGL